MPRLLSGVAISLPLLIWGPIGADGVAVTKKSPFMPATAPLFAPFYSRNPSGKDHFAYDCIHINIFRV